MRLRLPGGERDLRFDVRNTQFHALYMPDFLPCFEPETTALFARIVGTTGVFFDIGANWGWYTVVEASRPGFSGTVHAFEPNPPSFADLVGIVSQAGLDAHVQCHNIALGDHDGDATMRIPDGVHSGLATLDEKGARSWSSRAGPIRKLRKCRPLPYVFWRNGIIVCISWRGWRKMENRTIRPRGREDPHASVSCRFRRFTVVCS